MQNFLFKINKSNQIFKTLTTLWFEYNDDINLYKLFLDSERDLKLYKIWINNFEKP